MRKMFILGTLLSLLGTGIGYLFTNSGLYGICSVDAYQCRDIYNQIGDPLFYGMSALAVIFLILFLVPSAFNAWKKFAIWFVPLMAIIFAVYKGPSGGFMDPTPYPKQVFLWLSILYVAISLIIIAFSLYKSQNKNKK